MSALRRYDTRRYLSSHQPIRASESAVDERWAVGKKMEYGAASLATVHQNSPWGNSRTISEPSKQSQGTSRHSADGVFPIRMMSAALARPRLVRSLLGEQRNAQRTSQHRYPTYGVDISSTHPMPFLLAFSSHWAN